MTPARRPHGLPLVERLVQANTPATGQIALRSTATLHWCNCANDSVNRACWGFCDRYENAWQP